MDLSIQTNWQNKTKGQKIATVAAGVAGTAAVALTVAAAIKGGKILKADGFEPSEKYLNKAGEFKGIKKVGAQLAEGFKAIKTGVKTGATKAWAAVKGFAGKVFHKAEKAAEQAPVEVPVE